MSSGTYPIAATTRKVDWARKTCLSDNSPVKLAKRFEDSPDRTAVMKENSSHSSGKGPGRHDEPPRPAGYADLEKRPQRFAVLPADVARLKAYLEANAC